MGAAKKLTKKQELFVFEYLKDFNATRAAKAAKYSEKSAYAIGEQNLNKLEIKLAIESAVEKRNARVKVDADYVVTKWKSVVDADLTELRDLGKEGVTEVELKKIPKSIRTMITEITPVPNHKDGTWKYKLKFMSKDKATENLGKHVGALVDKIDITGNFKVTSFSDMVERVAKRKVK